MLSQSFTAKNQQQLQGISLKNSNLMNQLRHLKVHWGMQFPDHARRIKGGTLRNLQVISSLCINKKPELLISKSLFPNLRNWIHSIVIDDENIGWHLKVSDLFASLESSPSLTTLKIKNFHYFDVRFNVSDHNNHHFIRNMQEQL